MPYWGSSSRVGVQPTMVAANGKQKKRSERFSRKGITMEDLKKQTALRLAQEQNRHGPKQGGYVPRNSDHNNGEGLRASPPHSPPSARASARAQHRSPVNHSNLPYRDAHRSYANARPTLISIPTARPAEFSGSSSPSSSSSYNTGPTAPVSSFSESTSNKQKSKLPHGLTVQELKEMTKARLQAEAHSGGGGGGGQKPHPESARVVHTPEPRPSSRGMQPSPIPPGFAPRPEPAYMQHHEPENWEASQYMAPSFTESSSYGRSSSLPKTPPDFENRVRAATMSPRMQPFPLHEDRELDNFPSFSSEQQGRERAFTSYEPREQPGALGSYQPRERAFSSEPGLFSQNQHQSAFSTPGNRARTSSAASLQNTDDDFDSDVPQESSLRFHGSFGAVREDAPETPGLADVFRVSSFDKSPVLSMDSQENRMRASTWSGEHTHDARMRASTWSEPGSIFGCAGDMADDLASILKLSGAEDKNLF